MKQVIRSVLTSSALAFALLVGGGVSASAHSISNTGPHSYNKIYMKYHKNIHRVNNNHVKVNNYTVQYAKSGNAYVKGNTFGGHAVTGDVRNTSTTSTWVYIINR